MFIPHTILLTKSISSLSNLKSNNSKKEWHENKKRRIRKTTKTLLLLLLLLLLSLLLSSSSSWSFFLFLCHCFYNYLILNWREKRLILWEVLYVYWIQQETRRNGYILIVVSLSVEYFFVRGSRSTIDCGVGVGVGVKQYHLYLCFARRTPSPISSHINLISQSYWFFFLLLPLLHLLYRNIIASITLLSFFRKDWLCLFVKVLYR